MFFRGGLTILILYVRPCVLLQYKIGGNPFPRIYQTRKSLEPQNNYHCQKYFILYLSYEVLDLLQLSKNKMYFNWPYKM